jgi:hypothetical protein
MIVYDNKFTELVPMGKKEKEKEGGKETVAPGSGGATRL